MILGCLFNKKNVYDFKKSGFWPPRFFPFNIMAKPEQNKILFYAIVDFFLFSSDAYVILKYSNKLLYIKF